MEKAIIIECPGSGKSTFARKLAEKTGLPLYYLDMVWHRSDRTFALSHSASIIVTPFFSLTCL